MLQNKTCSTCGGNLSFNSKTGYFDCAFCGTIHVPDSGEILYSFDGAKRMMANRKYTEALRILRKLNEQDPNDPVILLKLLLCKYKSVDTGYLLSGSESRADLVWHDKDWTEIKAKLPEDKKDLVDNVREYCSLTKDAAALDDEMNKEKEKLAYLEEVRKNPAIVEDDDGDEYIAYVRGYKKKYLAIDLAFGAALLIVGIPSFILMWNLADDEMPLAGFLSLLLVLLVGSCILLFMTRRKKREFPEPSKDKLNELISKKTIISEKKKDLLIKIKETEASLESVRSDR
ncbi:MAG: hypothetical protein J6U54_21095 [Clostridiales bacterium]|nr:hypothetical protein [Clostridiales bacterium]